MATPVWVLSLEIANVRKALGQKDWQQTNLTDGSNNSNNSNNGQQ
ncbi:MAG TPA: hypothetical protein V6D37_01455 [Candidatus Sericytochromatia bacterium]|jgi:hypothetical protein